MMEPLVYDIEIVKAIPPKDGPLLTGIEYCAGWDDHANMGVACIGAYDFRDDRYRVFTFGNFKEFERLAKERLVVGFNSVAFDDVVCGHAGIEVTTDYDLLQEIWVAAGLVRQFLYPSHIGYGLDAMAAANGFQCKTGHGALAPVDWQRGYHGKVIDYCLQDVKLTWQLVRLAKDTAMLRNPKADSEKDVLNVTPYDLRRPYSEPEPDLPIPDDGIPF